MIAFDISDAATAGRRPRAHIERHALGIVFMFGGLVAVGAMSSALALAGLTPYWASGLVNLVVLYYFAHVNHEAVHVNISGSRSGFRWLNDFIGAFGGFWLFLPLPAFRTVHLAHHRLPNDPELDGDLWMAGRNALTTFLRCSTLLIGYEIRLWRLVRRGLAPTRALWETWAYRAVAIGLIVAAFVAGYGREVMLLWVIPALAVTPILAYLFAYIVHHPHDPTDPYRASRVILSRDKRLQPLVTSVFLFQNYHLVHHLNPRAPFYRYGDLYRAMADELRSRNVEVVTVL